MDKCPKCQAIDEMIAARLDDHNFAEWASIVFCSLMKHTDYFERDNGPSVGIILRQIRALADQLDRYRDSLSTLSAENAELQRRAEVAEEARDVWELACTMGYSWFGCPDKPTTENVCKENLDYQETCINCQMAARYALAEAARAEAGEEKART